MPQGIQEYTAEGKPIQEYDLNGMPVGAADKSGYTGIFSGKHPFVEFLPNEPAKSQHEMAVFTGHENVLDPIADFESNIPFIGKPLGELTRQMNRGVMGLISDPFAIAGGIEGLLRPKAPELPPSPIKRTQPLALPAGREPIGLLPAAGETYRPPAKYAAGPAGGPGAVAPINEGPIADALVSGSNVSGEPLPYPAKVNVTGPVVKGPVDLGEVREARRQANTFFTGQEQSGGSRLTIPDRPGLELPAIPGSNQLGFAAASRADLPYPLNIAPEAVRPRQAQTVQSALAPERFATREEPRVVKPNEPIIEPIQEYTAEGQPMQLPSAPPRKSIRELREAERVTDELRTRATTLANKTGLNERVLNQAAVNSPEPIQKAIVQLSREESKRPSVITNVYSEIKKLSPVLYQKANRAVLLARQYQAEWIPALEQSIRKLSKTEKLNFGAYVEGAAPITSPRVQEAVNAWRQVESSIGDTATAKRLRLYVDEKEHIPFQKHAENYWPHIPQEELVKGDFVERMVKEGVPRAEAQRISKHYQRTGEIVVGPQHAREVGKVFPYRLDADAALIHIRTMSKRIAQHEEFGPLDIMGKGEEGISDLIEGTTDPTLATKLMERVIGRDERADPKLMKFLDFSRQAAALTKLQNFTLSNMYLGQIPTALKASRHPIEAGKEIFKLFSKQYRNEMQLSGVWQNFTHGFVEEMSKLDPYQIGKGETFNRAISGAVGKGMAKAYLADLRKNPMDKLARSELADLLLEDVDQVIKQKELTENQLRMAAARMAEMTQGLNVPGNLPYFASNPVTGSSPERFAVQLALTFKKMGYMVTKSVKDSIMADPVRNIPTWIVMSQLMGEATGDTKAFLKGMWTGDPMGAIANRGAFAERMGSNALQSFMLGLPYDLISSSSYGPFGLMSAAAGPVISDASKLANSLYQAGKGKFKPLARQAISALPLPGSTGLADELLKD